MERNKLIEDTDELNGTLKRPRCSQQQTNLQFIENDKEKDFEDTAHKNFCSKECSSKDIWKQFTNLDLSLPDAIINKDPNFECDEEWDIGGIPELLSDLDADIENSLKVDLQLYSSKSDWDKYLNISQGDLFKTNSKSEKFIRTKNNWRFPKNNSCLGNSTKLFLHSCASENTEICFKLNQKTNECLDSMASQNANNSTISSNSTSISSAGGNQAGLSSNINIKSSTKMSIDHQATLDKGLKMKIKRTKPGSKSSEAKHEIVKASEQLQNGIMENTADVCISVADNSSAISALNSSSSTLLNNLGNNTPNSTCSSGNKKIVSNTNNQINSNNTSSITNNANSGISISSQSSSIGSKRTNSGHRRDKAKDKSSHSNRAGTEKLFSQNNEKDIQEAPCHCTIGDGNGIPCNSNVCIRRNENNIAQRLPNKSAVPPGVFTPSSDTQRPGNAASTMLSATTTVTSPVITHSSTVSCTANAPGPPNKDTNNVSNIKISSHIAAQLAAAAASNCTMPNMDIKTATSIASSQPVKQMAPGQISATVQHSVPAGSNKPALGDSIDTMTPSVNSILHSDESMKSPPSKRVKHTDTSAPKNANAEMVDICIGTSVGTITEPDCLGPCEPGTSVTLEGIVWHETEGGVLVVNVTWRGKTYVGTLLDCTRHDWAPPRFCDSPTDELDSRTPKGRGKRGRAVTTPDLSNFTETRSSIYFSHPHVHSKLRNGSSKSGRGNSKTTNTVEKNNSASSVSSANGGSTPSTSPIAFLPPRAEKRKSKDEPSSPISADDSSSTSIANASGIPISASGGGLLTQPQNQINPMTGLNVQISAKKCKTSPCAISPVLLECPEQDCSKKYKHANGLRYHQSHAHGSGTLLEDDFTPEADESAITPFHSPVSAVPALVSEAMNDIKPSLKLSDESDIRSKSSDVDTMSSPYNRSENVTDNDAEITHSDACNDEILHPDSVGATLSSATTIQETNTQNCILDGNKENMNDILPFEQKNSQQSPLGKIGVLRFGQADSKFGHENSPQIEANLSRNQEDLILLETSSSKAESVSTHTVHSLTTSKDCNNPLQKAESSDSISGDTLSQNQQNDNKPSSTTVPVKQKKNRKSPAGIEFEADGLNNTCHHQSREEVQSPAYSDISDDSTPINDQLLLNRNTTKNCEIVKKVPEVALSSESACCNNVQGAIPPPLGGYGVYQFYQQQQFMVQPPNEQQPSSKNSSISNIALPTPSTSQESPILTELNKKEQSLDLLTKTTTASLQNACQASQDVKKEIQLQPSILTNQTANALSNSPSLGPNVTSSSAPPKSVSHFYAFNYMSPNYGYNVDQNFVPIPIPAEDSKISRHSSILSPTEQQQSTIVFKDEGGKDITGTNESVKVLNQPQILPTKAIKTEYLPKPENIKTEPTNIVPSHNPHHTKDLQGMGVYTNMYQRHPISLTSQQLSREEEMRRYYIFSDHQRRSTSINNAPSQVCLPQSNQMQCKDDSTSAQGNSQSQPQMKLKSSVSVNHLGNGGKSTATHKDSPKQKQDDEVKHVKQEGQKPTMETQGPPPPPTSQYFLHPSYMAPTPFGFDPNHPMYRNVLIPPTSPYSTAPYHLPMTRYHAPEDLSRNTGTKAIDVLHHAANQYYTTHKIHELSDRAIKSPTGNGNGTSTVKISNSSPAAGSAQLSNISANPVVHHTSSSQSSCSSQLSHNLSSQTNAAPSNKQDIPVQKPHGNGSNIPVHNEVHKPQTVSSTAGVTNNSSGNPNSIGGTDSRSPPPQRHVHTHHHTHVGIGYPMYPAPYGAAVLASQQAAAVAVINPFPPGANK